MRANRCLVIALLTVTLGSAVHTQDLPISVTREIHRETTEDYDVTSNSVGEVIGGTFDGPGLSGTVDVFDVSGQRLRDFRFRNGSIAVGIVSPAPGRYRIKVTATPIESSGTYVLNMRRQSQSERLKGRLVHPREDYESGRIARLKADLKAGAAGAEDHFWAELVRAGAPLVESIPRDDDHVLMTFVWKEAYDTHNVLLVWPPTFYHADDYYLCRLSGTKVWHKTIRVRQGSRFSYAFSPNDLPGERDITSYHDPLNPRRAYEPDGSYSLAELPGAPDEKWATMTPQRRGVVSQQTFESNLLNGRRSISIYTPPDYASDKDPHPLVILSTCPCTSVPG